VYFSNLIHKTSNLMVTTNFNARFIDNPLNCPVTRTMSIIGGKWKPIILNCIGDKKIRFGKLNQIIPAISNKVLANELKELEGYGLIKRTEFVELPPRVEYELTNAGKTLMPILYEIANWGNSHVAKKIIKELV
jgi:DNA-binding HxlR family transcriptional regulator